MALYPRPTGLSLLVGFMDVGLCEVSRYVQELGPALKELRVSLRGNTDQTAQSAHRSYPKDHYKPCAYLGIGQHNLLTFTIVREQGYGGRIAFMGSAHGQTFFHAHDYSLVIDLNLLEEWGDDPKPILKALQDLGISEVLKVRANGKGCKKSEPTGADSRQEPHLHWRYTLNEPVKRKYNLLSPKTATEKDHIYFGEFRPLIYNHIYAGEVRQWENGPFDYKYDWFKNKSIEEVKDELMYFVQLRINIPALIKYSTTIRTFAYLATLLYLHQRLTNTKIHEKPIVRIFFTDGYFDLGILLRGKNIQHLDSLTQGLRSINLGEVSDLLVKYKLRFFKDKYWPSDNDSTEETPLFILSNTSVGVPYAKLLEIENKCEHSQAASDCDEDEYIRRTKEEYAIYCKKFKLYNTGPDMTMSSRLSIYNYRTKEIIKDMDFIYENIINPKICLKKHHLVDRFDLELTPVTTLPFGQHLANLFFSVNYLQRNGFKEAEEPLIFQRINSPILEMRSIIETNIETLTDEINKGIPSTKQVYPGLKDGMMKLLSPKNLTDHIKNISENGEVDELKADLQRTKIYNSAHYQFDSFLQKRFGTEVSWITLERFSATFNLIDNYLSEPLLFDIYLDVHKYCNQILKTIFNDGSGDKSIQMQGNSLNGTEAYLSNVSDLLQEIIDQRQAGSFPHYYKCITRLTDLRVHHLKKLTALSWLINRMRVNFITLNNHEKCSSRVQYLACFKNAPEIGCIPEKRAIHLNNRFLTSNEQTIVLVHEIGHTITHDLDLIENITVIDNGEKITIEENNNLDSIGIERRKTFTIELDNDINPIQGAKETKQTKYKQKHLWEDIFADLLVFNHCFSPLSKAIWGAEDKPSNFKNRSLKLTYREDEFDIYDDFILAWVFQLIHLPKITREYSINFIGKRLFTVYFILKTSTEDLKTNQTTINEKIVVLHQRLKHKSLNYLNKIITSSPDTKNKLAGCNKDTWTKIFETTPGLMQQELIYSYLNVFQGKNSTKLPTCMKMNGEFGNKLKSLAKITSQDTCSKITEPQFKSFSSIRLALEGILEERAASNNSNDEADGMFARVLQLAGIASLGFVQDYEKNQDFKFVEGYPFFPNHSNQRKLARVRRLISGCLLRGKMAAIRDYLAEIGVSLRRH